MTYNTSADKTAYNFYDDACEALKESQRLIDDKAKAKVELVKFELAYDSIVAEETRLFDMGATSKSALKDVVKGSEKVKSAKKEMMNRDAEYKRTQDQLNFYIEVINLNKTMIKLKEAEIRKGM